MPVVLRELTFSPAVGRIFEAVRESYPGQDIDGTIEAICTAAAVMLSEWSRVEPMLYKEHRSRSKRAIADLQSVIQSDDAVAAVKVLIQKQQGGIIVATPSQRM